MTLEATQLALVGPGAAGLMLTLSLLRRQPAHALGWALGGALCYVLTLSTPNVLSSLVLDTAKSSGLTLTLSSYLLYTYSLLAALHLLVLAAFFKLLNRTSKDARAENLQAPIWAARWASAGELKHMQLERAGRSEQSRALLLGIFQGHVMGVSPGQGRRELGHALVVGPSRSGKGLHLIRNALNWRGSLVTVDIKGENFRLSAGYRQGIGPVFRLDPSGKCSRYDPFSELGYSSESLRAAAELIIQSDADGGNRIFGQRASGALFAGLRGAALEGEATLPYLRRLTAKGVEGYVRHLAHLRDAEIRHALTDFLGVEPEDFTLDLYKSDRFLSSSWQNMITRCTPLWSEGLLAMTAHSDFEARDLFETPCSVYLTFSEAELEHTALAFRVVLLALITALIRYGDEHPDPPAHTVLLAFDEAGRVPVPKLPELISTVAGRGMAALIYIQDLKWLEAAYGDKGANIIRGNCHTQIFFRPLELDTARYISERCGKTTIFEERRGISSGNSKNLYAMWSGSKSENKSHSVTQRERSLITPDEVMLLGARDMIVFASGQPPARMVRFEPHSVPVLKAFMALEAPVFTVRARPGFTYEGPPQATNPEADQTGTRNHLEAVRPRRDEVGAPDPTDWIDDL